MRIFYHWAMNNKSERLVVDCFSLLVFSFQLFLSQWADLNSKSLDETTSFHFVQELGHQRFLHILILSSLYFASLTKSRESINRRLGLLSQWADLNRRPLPYHGSALPTELHWRLSLFKSDPFLIHVPWTRDTDWATLASYRFYK